MANESITPGAKEGTVASEMVIPDAPSEVMELPPPEEPQREVTDERSKVQARSEQELPATAVELRTC